MEKIIPTKDAAKRLSTPGKSVSIRRVQQLAAELGLPRLGRQYLITERDLAKMAARNTRPGPKGGKSR
jgi:hypothetical protein